ncbi:uncharacterized protein PgNI_03030 [Pyricularia grisea]|uniref:Uncharacterized protein n=1 Tax=Pyricularia grisea TaxID=148305 RepID=A0A6P8B982_PYRGI|nr:uncharacterized protein PgNI_03030 [Pyricularia grisea]TLD12366.1 hypothetical protein PgNI_03030 [Pyricularia grisea]
MFAAAFTVLILPRETLTAGNQLDSLNFVLEQWQEPATSSDELIRFYNMHQILPLAMDLTTSFNCFRRCYKYQPIAHAGHGCCTVYLRYEIGRAVELGDIDTYVYMMASYRRTPRG